MASTSLQPQVMEEDHDYYGLFNVERTATSEDINKAFKRLSRIYHPDRHQQPELKAKAEALFDKLRKAYEVLSDPDKRSIYDTLGQRGLDVTGWELAEYGRHPDEIRAQYERLARIRRDNAMRDNLNPTGNVIVQVSAVDWFTPSFGACLKNPDKEAPYVDVLSVSMEQGVETPLTASDRLSFGGGLSSKNGVGGGTAALAWRRLVSPLVWAELGLSINQSPGLILKVHRTFSKHCFGSLSLQNVLSSEGPAFGIVGSLTRQLDRRLTGTLTAKLGLEQQLITSLAFDSASHQRIISSIVIGHPLSYVALSWTYSPPRVDAQLKSVIKAGPQLGIVAELGWEGRLSEFNRGGAAFRINLSRGTLILKLRFQRGSQGYALNVNVCDNADYLPTSVLSGVVMPLLGYVLIRELGVPLWRRFVSGGDGGDESWESRRAREALEERRSEAASSVALMKAGAERSRMAEAAKNGLVILSAYYGRQLSPEVQRSIALEDLERQGGLLEVSVPLQVQVQDSKLILYDRRKSSLAGFYDPCPGEAKFLSVHYRFRNAEHRVTVQDDHPLLIPKATHKVS